MLNASSGISIHCSQLVYFVFGLIAVEFLFCLFACFIFRCSCCFSFASSISLSSQQMHVYCFSFDSVKQWKYVRMRIFVQIYGTGRQYTNRLMYNIAIGLTTIPPIRIQHCCSQTENCMGDARHGQH